ncbi:hypothetical protein PLICRDRAFT_45759 [Plicaturopsis crispa FD-325 SS-3]|uniref:Uncharacterized protein n=1 Tax=Plicaturopsis crispa FD-325 SS-3 TaxID=944288 RepID=A0A0C9SRQ2_PLICR|nr:hypothetical protein PLICRDRAFT_45759 [Plicaturopsis crispa FD-325 SS-3]
MKSIDIRSQSAVKLIAEFLDMDADVPYEEGGRHVNAEHFAHEVYCYLRSPYRDLTVYDSVVQVCLCLHLNTPPFSCLHHTHRCYSPRMTHTLHFTQSSYTN